MWVCNCKSINKIHFHKTKVFDGGRCYYCGHYALEGQETIPFKDYYNYLYKPWRYGPFKFTKSKSTKDEYRPSPLGAAKQREAPREEMAYKFYTVDRLSKKEIANIMNISYHTVHSMIYKYTKKNKLIGKANKGRRKGI